MYRDIKGLLFIILGIMLVVIAAGDLIFKLLVALVGFWLIQQGLMLRNMPSLSYWYRSWKHHSRF